MKMKVLSMLNSAKKKVGAVILCGGLVATISAGTVFAANPITSLKVKMENGVRSYSTDDGKTWSQTAPIGFNEMMIEVGKLPKLDGVLPKGGKMKSINIKQENGNEKNLPMKEENGVKSYSTDGGKTWSEKVPVGLEGILMDDVSTL